MSQENTAQKGCQRLSDLGLNKTSIKMNGQHQLEIKEEGWGYGSGGIGLSQGTGELFYGGIIDLQ